MRIEMLVFDGLDEMDLMGPFEVWSHAANRTEFSAEIAATIEYTRDRDLHVVAPGN